MILEQRIGLLEKLGKYILSEEPQWLQAKETAYRENPWFIPEFIDCSCRSIAEQFLRPGLLQQIASQYGLPENNPKSKTVGIVMAGNLPLVGFHDFCCGLLCGHRLHIKPSSKDQALISHLTRQLISWAPSLEPSIVFSTLLKGCDAYIATGSNQSSRYFEQYFSHYPHIIRKNRTGVALLDGQETPEELQQLADDVHLYFGLGCRNVTKLFVPEGYDFIPLLESFKKYAHLSHHHKYRNNYDYQLALLLLNNQPYMTNGTILVTENPALHAPISQLYFEYYPNRQSVLEQLQNQQSMQCLVGAGFLPFGQTQQPGFTDFADGVDTLKFLRDC